MKPKISLKKQRFISRSDLARKNNHTFRERIDAANAWIDIDECQIKQVKPGFISIIPPSK